MSCSDGLFSASKFWMWVSLQKTPLRGFIALNHFACGSKRLTDSNMGRQTKSSELNQFPRYCLDCRPINFHEQHMCFSCPIRSKCTQPSPAGAIALVLLTSAFSTWSVKIVAAPVILTQTSSGLSARRGLCCPKGFADALPAHGRAQMPAEGVRACRLVFLTVWSLRMNAT